MGVGGPTTVESSSWSSSCRRARATVRSARRAASSDVRSVPAQSQAGAARRFGPERAPSAVRDGPRLPGPRLCRKRTAMSSAVSLDRAGQRGELLQDARHRPEIRAREYAGLTLTGQGRAGGLASPAWGGEGVWRVPVSPLLSCLLALVLTAPAAASPPLTHFLLRSGDQPGFSVSGTPKTVASAVGVHAGRRQSVADLVGGEHPQPGRLRAGRRGAHERGRGAGVLLRRRVQERRRCTRRCGPLALPGRADQGPRSRRCSRLPASRTREA